MKNELNMEGSYWAHLRCYYLANPVLAAPGPLTGGQLTQGHCSFRLEALTGPPGGPQSNPELKSHVWAPVFKELLAWVVINVHGVTHTFWWTWSTQLQWARAEPRPQSRQRPPRSPTTPAVLVEETRHERFIIHPALPWSAVTAELWRWRLPWTMSWMEAAKEPLGKAETLQAYQPASLSARSLMIRDCSWMATLSFRNVSWTFTPCWWWKTRMTVSFCAVSLNPHWTCVTLSFFGPGTNLQGRKASCRRYPVTLAWDMIVCAWKPAPRNRHRNHPQPFCCSVGASLASSFYSDRIILQTYYYFF